MQFFDCCSRCFITPPHCHVAIKSTRKIAKTKNLKKFHPPMTTIHELFDAVCFSTGDLDAIAPTPPLEPICYFEVQALSESLAAQVHHRFRPQATQTVLLLQLDGNTLLEAISVLAASRLKLPWITLEEMRSSHLEIIAEDLRRAGGYQTLLAIVQASGDEDFKCQTMFKAGVHKVLCMNDYGMINNSMNVPSSLPTPPETSSSDDLYIMFTSGTSGGTPKAVVGSTKSTIKRLQWFNDQFSVGGTRVARKTDLAFVDGVTELLSALLYGGCLVDIEHWKGLPERVDIDRVTLLPSQLEQLLRIVEDGEVGTKSSIGMICLSGEICPHAVAASKHFGGEKGYFRKTMLLNLYGQTETTGDVTYYCLRNGPKKGECCVNWIEEGDGIVPVGRPWAENVKIIIEDGEIVLLVDENSSFSNGYLRNNENGNSETYNTGDEGFLKDGILYVTGRVGGISSGKVNGKMVVASEAEYSLHMDGGLPGVRVIVHKNCCWAFVLNSVDADANAVKKLRGKMPLHLAPRKVFVLGEFPLCARAAGKIDNMRLKQIVDDWVSGNVAEVGDDNNNNNAFMNLVKAQLGVDDIDSSHSFVENGGDSMLAVTFLHSLKKAKKVKGMKGELKMSDVLGAESLNDLERIWKGEGRAKRRKVDVPSPPSSQFTPVVEVDEDTGGAWSVSFKACVDSGPVFVNRGEQKLVIAGCQGGSFLAIDMVTKSVVGAQALEGAVEGAAVVDDDKVFVASYKKEGGRSWVSCFNVTLETLIWRTQLDGALVKSSVVLSGEALRGANATFQRTSNSLHSSQVRQGVCLSRGAISYGD